MENQLEEENTQKVKTLENQIIKPVTYFLKIVNIIEN